MDDRKDYAAPAIAAEDVLEQTSLACQASEPFPAGPGTTYVTGIGFCNTNVAKGGAFIKVELGCTSAVPNVKNAVVLS